MFTNIPLQECIDFAVSYITDGNSDLKLSKSDLIKLVLIATSQTHFLFNDKVYDQVDGVAMDSSLAPVLANLFLGHHERLWLNTYKGPPVHLYRRYVDDTFCLFNIEHEALLFLQYLNSQHENIRFTMGKEFNRTLAFLDVCINNKDPSCLITSVYHKKTFTGLLTNFFSFTSFSYKLGLIRTLLDRAYKINNTPLAFNEDAKKLSYTLKRNQFPEHLINKIIKAYLDRVNNSTTPCKDSDTTSDGICTLYFKLPCLVLSNFVQHKVHMLTKHYCRNLSIKLVFSSFKIKNLMNVKDTVPRSVCSNVVYKLNCAERNSAYVGETSRHLST